MSALPLVNPLYYILFSLIENQTEIDVSLGNQGLAALSAEAMSPEQIERLSVYLNQWEEIDFEDRRQVADGLISQIRATDEHVSIEWKI